MELTREGYYGQDTQGPYELFDLGPFETDQGALLSECNLAFATHGELNGEKDNAILVPTWYSGTSKAISDIYVGPGRALDPTKYFIIIVNQLGGGVSQSPNNSDGDSFPQITIADDVRAQARLVREWFGIRRLAGVVGGSMGGQQAFQWARDYPESVAKVIAIAASPVGSEMLTMVLDGLSDALNTPSSESVGLTLHARLWAKLGWSPEFWIDRLHKNLGFETADQFVSGFMEQYFAPMDRRVLTVMLQKAAHIDALPREEGTAPVKVLVIPIDTDLVFPAAAIERDCSDLPNVTISIAQTHYGHFALFGVDANFLSFIDAEVSSFLAS